MCCAFSQNTMDKLNTKLFPHLQTQDEEMRFFLFSCSLISFREVFCFVLNEMELVSVHKSSPFKADPAPRRQHHRKMAVEICYAGLVDTVLWKKTWKNVKNVHWFCVQEQESLGFFLILMDYDLVVTQSVVDFQRFCLFWTIFFVSLFLMIQKSWFLTFICVFVFRSPVMTDDLSVLHWAIKSL